MTDTRSITKEYRLAYWAQIMKDRSKSGENIRAYCERTGIHENTYYYWQKKLREAAYTEKQGVKQPDALPIPAVPSGWAMISKERRKASPQELTVEVGGFRITVNENTEPSLHARHCVRYVDV